MKFTAPQTISPFFNYTKFPRKKKKKLKKLDYPFLTLNQKMWLELGKEYKDFIIQKICK